MKIALKLEEARERKGVSRKQLARSMGVTRTAVCAWETGRNSITLGRIVQAAKALGCKPGELLEVI